MTFFSPQVKHSANSGSMPFLKPNSWILFFSFILCAYMLFGRLGGLALISPDEGRNAEVAREMSQSHAWLVPTYNGLVYLDKPSFTSRPSRCLSHCSENRKALPDYRPLSLVSRCS